MTLMKIRIRIKINLKMITMQILLFARDKGWTHGRIKDWFKSEMEKTDASLSRALSLAQA